MDDEKAFLTHFGKRMAVFRKHANITQEKLAEVVGVHRTYIGFIEQGRRNPSIGTIYRIATALGIPLKCLFEPF
jgi:transcriptional regulator with XRE-family HTH domain